MTIIFFCEENPKTPINYNPSQTSVFPTVVAGLKKLSLTFVNPFEFDCGGVRVSCRSEL